MLKHWMEMSANMAKYVDYMKSQVGNHTPKITPTQRTNKETVAGPSHGIINLEKVGSHSSRQGREDPLDLRNSLNKKKAIEEDTPDIGPDEQEEYEERMEDEDRRRVTNLDRGDPVPKFRTESTRRERYLLDEMSPLSYRIQKLSSQMESSFLNNLPRFYGNSDPREHLSDVKDCLNMCGLSDGVMTKMLGHTLRDAAKRWYRKLKPQSIDCFADLAEAFKLEFATSTKSLQLGSRIYTIIQKKDETLRSFMKRFKEAVRESDVVTPPMVKQTLYQALQPCDLSSLLARTDFDTITKIFELANEFIIEEDMKEAKIEQRKAMLESIAPLEAPKPNQSDSKKTSGQPMQGQKNPAGSGSNNAASGRYKNKTFDTFTPLRMEPDKIFSIMEVKEVFRTPVPLKGRVQPRNRDKFCEYHKRAGHITNHCKHLRVEVERLIQHGILPKYMYTSDVRDIIDQRRDEISDGRRSHDQRDRSRSPRKKVYKPNQDARDEDFEEENPSNKGVIYTIGGGDAAGATKTRRRKIAKDLANQEEKTSKGPSLEILNVFRGCEAITFSEADLEGQHAPAYEPLVFTIDIAGYSVRKCLVDGGSSVDILSFQALKEMQIDTARLKPTDSPLRAFGGGEIMPLGLISLPTSLGSGRRRRTEVIEYTVVNAPFHYNVIIGRPSLAKFQAVPSSYHLKMKFPTPGGVGEMRCDLRIARECYNNFTDHTPPKAQKIHDPAGNVPKGQGKSGEKDAPETSSRKRKNPEAAEFDARITPADGYRKIELIPGDKSKTAKIGMNLEADTEVLLIELLQKNADVFAWSPLDMKGISPNVIEHRLNVDPDAKPVKQKKRCFGLERNKIIAGKVEELLSAKYIEEVKYSEWLCNPVLVPKKEEQWRMCNDFTDLNKACPKDHFPLPRIDILVDSTAGCAILSMLDAYQGYNQILMALADKIKTAFITEGGVYCFRVMPFGLKNAGATYQRLMSIMFKNQIGKTVEVYVDDMIVKSREEKDHIADLEECFQIMREYGLKLNPEKCTFGVRGGKFLGFMVTQRGIEANPEKIAAIINMTSPKTIKEVQRLAGRLVALGRFIARYADKGLPFLKVLRKIKDFQWTEECEQAFQDLKRYLMNPPLLKKPICGEKLFLYLAVSEAAISSVLVKEEGGSHYPVYYVSHMLQGAEKNYQDIEKLVFALIHTARRLRPYFLSHHVVVLTNQPLRQILAKPNVSGRVIKWAVELGEYDVTYEPRTAMKAQVAADFLVEMIPMNNEGESEELTVGDEKGKRQLGVWTLHVDGSAISTNGGVGILLQGPEGIELEFALKLNFKVTNNIAEYEALLAGMRMAIKHEITDLRAFTDSQLVAQQFDGSYEARDKAMTDYLAKVKEQAAKFKNFTLQQIPREENERADALSKFANSVKGVSTRNVTILVANKSEIDVTLSDVLAVESAESNWKDDMTAYLKEGLLPENPNKARQIIRTSGKFALMRGELYRRSCTGILLRCLTQKEADWVIKEIHSGSCGSHSAGRALSQKILRQGYYWPSLRKDAHDFTKRCVPCQFHANIPHQPAVPMEPIEAACPFDMWGVDLVGPLPKGLEGKRYIVVAVEYFSKWVEAKALSTIEEETIIQFLWQNILTRFGMPRVLVADNGAQFRGKVMAEWCQKYRIQQNFASVANPQANGQTEVTNRTILSAIKKKVLGHKNQWVQELDGVLWSYRTTARTSTGETPFVMVYGSEAIIPAEVGMPTGRIKNYEKTANRDARVLELDLIEELRERGRRKTEIYKQSMALAYNKRMKARSFQVGDLVLKRAKATKNVRKLEPQWLGPFKISKVTRKGSYRMEDMKGEALKKSWNVRNLIRYYA